MCTGLFNEKPQPLSSAAYVGLTEAVTYIVAGDSRGDAFLAKKNAEWNPPSGAPSVIGGLRPYWLFPHLQSLMNGHESAFEEDAQDSEHRDKNLEFSAAKLWAENWQKGKSTDLAHALDYVKNWCQEYKVFYNDTDRCLRIIFDDCANQKMELIGSQLNSGSLRPTSHKLIDYIYFTSGVRYNFGEIRLLSRGLSPTIGNKLSPVLSNRISLDVSRPEYIDIRIRRAGVLRVEKRFNKPTVERIKKPPVSNASLEKWYIDRVNSWPADKVAVRRGAVDTSLIEVDANK